MGHALGVAAGAGNGGILELARVAVILCAAALGAGALAACRGERAREPLPLPGARGPHVRVEVLNAGGRAGAARIATRALRQAGIDVVAFGNANPGGTPLDSTQIVIRRGDPGVASAVRAALGAGRVVLQPDSGRLVDASVLLGADFSPRLEFHP